MGSIRHGLPLVGAAALSLLLAGTVLAAPAGPRHARGTFVDASGAEIGTVRLSEDGHGIVHVRVKIRGLSAGLHGIHIHSVGACSPTFLAAGGHYNPLGHQHGLDNPNGPHAGDLPTSSSTSTAMVDSTPGRTG